MFSKNKIRFPHRLFSTQPITIAYAPLPTPKTEIPRSNIEFPESTRPTRYLPTKRYRSDKKKTQKSGVQFPKRYSKYERGGRESQTTFRYCHPE